MAKVSPFVTGGTLDPSSPLYIERSADRELIELCRRGEFCYVLTSRQMGKSSLMARTAVALQAEGVSTVQIDLTTIGAHELTAEQWYLGLLNEVESACRPRFDLFSWWDQHKDLPLVQRFSQYFEELLAQEPDKRVVVFVDEIDSTLNLNFTDDFFAAIRAFYNARVTKPAFSRLSFVLIGVATPGELIQDQTRTPFNIGTRVELNDFTRDEARPLIEAVKLKPDDTKRVLDRVLFWTNGQPFLTQRLCKLIAENGTNPLELDRVVYANLLGEKVRGDSHFLFVGNMLVQARPDQKGRLFDTYSKTLKGRRIACDDQSPIHNRLRLAGIVKRVDGGLQVRNELYRRVFDWNWIKTNRPTFWTQANKRLAWTTLASLVVALVIALLALQLNEQRKAAEEARQLSEKARQLSEETQQRLAVSLSKEKKALEESEKQRIRAQIAEEKAQDALRVAQKERALAERSAAEAKRQALAARGGELAAAAVSALTVADPDIALLLANYGHETAPLNPLVWQASWLTLDNIHAQYVLRGHQGLVISAAFSPDGRRVVTASADRTARVWDGEKGTVIAELRGHQGLTPGAARRGSGPLPTSGTRTLPSESLATIARTAGRLAGKLGAWPPCSITAATTVMPRSSTALTISLVRSGSDGPARLRFITWTRSTMAKSIAFARVQLLHNASGLPG
jgi:AAA-like domain/WD domain, G-beta repeat